MYIKIYFDAKPLFLCDTLDETILPYVHHDDSVFIDELNSHTVKAMIHEMQLAKINAGIFYHPDLEALRKAFYKKFTLVKAAGGLVQNDSKKILMIFRRGKWDLPKGKLDTGETLEECAVREVEEETNLQNLQLISPLLTTYHTYHEGARFYLKESYWFLMQAKGGQQPVPQTAEGITDIQWVSAAQAKKFYTEAYPSVADVIQHYIVSTAD